MIYVLGAATLIHIAIFGWMPIRALAWASLDDALFIRMADLISSGQWLGGFSSTTLAKGPAYPLFITLCHKLHIPLALGQELAHVGSCAALAIAIRPLVRKRWWADAIYLLLLFDPWQWETSTMARVLRQHIYAPLGLITMASIIGCATATKRWVTFLWVALGGLSLGFFWITREESIWIVVPIATFVFVALLFPRQARPDRRAMLVRVAALIVLASAPPVMVAALNYANYGTFTTNDVNGEPYKSAYASLIRVSPENRIRFVPVPRATRMEIYEVSPAFRELRPFLEGRMGEEAVNHSTRVYGDSIRGEIAGGWFYWLLRMAVEQAGHYESASTAAAYYRRLEHEVSTACESGKLRCSPRSGGFLPELTMDDLETIAKSFTPSLAGFLLMDGRWDRFTPSEGEEEGLALFAETTGSELTPTVAPPITFRVRILWFLSWAYRVAGAVLGTSVVVALLSLVTRFVRTRRATENLAVSLSLLAGVLAYVTLNVMVDAIAFPASGKGSHVVVHAWFLAAALILLHDHVAGDHGTHIPPHPIESAS